MTVLNPVIDTLTGLLNLKDTKRDRLHEETDGTITLYIPWACWVL